MCVYQFKIIKIEQVQFHHAKHIHKVCKQWKQQQQQKFYAW